MALTTPETSVGIQYDRSLHEPSDPATRTERTHVSSFPEAEQNKEPSEAQSGSSRAAPSKTWPQNRVRWMQLSEEPNHGRSTIPIPSAYDEAIHRSRVTTVNTGTNIVDFAQGAGDNASKLDELQRGRTPVRTLTLIPAQHRLLSPAATQRRLAPLSTSVPSTSAQPFLTTDAPPTPGLLSPKPNREILLEPKPECTVPTAVSELISPSGSSEGSVSDSPGSPASSYFDVARRHSRSSRRSVGDALSPEDGIIVNTTPFDERHTYHRLSVSEMHFKNHRDTFALLSLPKKHPRYESRALSLVSTFSGYEQTLPLAVISLVVDHLDHECWCAVRLSCRTWSTIVTLERPPKIPALYYLPVELIQQIYDNLSPIEFNAARHSCRSWMAASMDQRLLKTMLRRGGWWTGAQLRLGKTNELPRDKRIELMSRYLTRECCLSPPSSVSSLMTPDLSAMPGSYFATFDGADADRPSNSSTFEQVLQVDLSELSLGGSFRRDCSLPQQDVDDDGLLITTSTCGQFILIVDGNRIFIYSLEYVRTKIISFAPPDDDRKPTRRRRLSLLTSVIQPNLPRIVPVTSIVCPRQVLAVSMDTSSGRYAVAALLEHRMGMLCDLLEGSRSSPESTPEYIVKDTRRSHGSLVRTLPLRGSSPSRSPQTASMTSDGLAIPRPESLRDPAMSLLSVITGPIPIETGPRSIYRSLGSHDDPPLSVAICPQRRCVAFGCASGIELHWVDAMTGQDLNRWFPLTASSDFLYFLPPRPGVDNKKKLRLVSSSCTGAMGASLRSRQYIRRAYRLPSEPYPDTTPWHSDIGSGVLSHNGQYTPESVDNYRAIPLSDGHHILFIDPISSQLCLGVDAPIGGPVKLVHRVLFQGPNGKLPHVYAAGHYLSHGVRIVAGYDNELWFFTVPTDIFNCDMSGLHEPWAPYYFHGQSKPSTPETEFRELTTQYNFYNEAGRPVLTTRTSSTSETSEPQSVWPLTIHGTYVATVPHLRELALNAEPTEFTIWAFAADSIARAWQIRSSKPQILSMHYVNRNGALFARADQWGSAKTPPSSPNSPQTPELQAFCPDPDGDVPMPDAPPLPEGLSPQIVNSPTRLYGSPQRMTDGTESGLVSQLFSPNPSVLPSPIIPMAEASIAAVQAHSFEDVPRDFPYRGQEIDVHPIDEDMLRTIDEGYWSDDNQRQRLETRGRGGMGSMLRGRTLGMVHGGDVWWRALDEDLGAASGAMQPGSSTREDSVWGVKIDGERNVWEGEELECEVVGAS